MDGINNESINVRRFRIFGRNSKLIFAGVALLLLCAVFELGRFSVYKQHPELAAAEQVQKILVQVGKIIQLPTGETPSVATVKDAVSIKQGQPFLANAQNGDILIVYANKAEAFLYRPSTNRLINVGPVNTSAGSGATQ